MLLHGIVIDTCVVASAVKSKRGASFKLLSLIESDKFVFHLSVPLVCEYQDVLKRSEFGDTWTEAEIDELLDLICSIGVKHDIWYLWRPLLQDEGDEFVAELAIAAQAGSIVTFNKKDFKSVEKFGVKILTPQEFLREIGETT